MKTRLVFATLIIVALLASCIPATPPPPTATPVPPTATSTPEPEQWEYVSMGGDFTYAMRWNEIYAAYIETDLGVKVTLTDVSFHSRKTLADMLEQLQTDQEFRALVENAEAITFSVPTESYTGGAQGMYLSGICGGEDGEQCLRDSHERAVGQLRIYLDELTSLANPSDAIMWTFVWGTVDAWMGTMFDQKLTDEDARVFIRYADSLNEAIREIAMEYGITVVDIAPYYQPDGLDKQPGDDIFGRVGPTDKAVQIVADLLREAGYAPLKP